ncbi:hypothetical protein GGX14DRAFT_559068 [Mycena pura]|uniref:Uncharacterized protein n=1 Tax=Mycena pura TaxID=153505 RepID=A0AAD6VXC2_9AGAR|nr:hypothetical protein GGX14DRAFT_559068 [Mycena pura]
MYQNLVFILFYISLCALLLALPRGIPEPLEVIIAAITIGSSLCLTTYALVKNVIGERVILVICNWAAFLCLCVRAKVLEFTLHAITFLLPLLSFVVLTFLVETTYLAIHEQAPSRIHDVTFPVARLVVEGFFRRLLGIANAEGSWQGAWGGDTVGSGRDVTGGNTVGSGAGATGSAKGAGPSTAAGTAQKTQPPLYALDSFV